MTTRVTIYAGHGWPVDVTPVGPGAGPKRRVDPGVTAEFCVHSGQDLLIHEVQPAELVAEDGK